VLLRLTTELNSRRTKDSSSSYGIALSWSSPPSDQTIQRWGGNANVQVQHVAPTFKVIDPKAYIAPQFPYKFFHISFSSPDVFNLPSQLNFRLQLHDSDSSGNPVERLPMNRFSKAEGKKSASLGRPQNPSFLCGIWISSLNDLVIRTYWQEVLGNDHKQKYDLWILCKRVDISAERPSY